MMKCVFLVLDEMGGAGLEVEQVEEGAANLKNWPICCCVRLLMALPAYCCGDQKFFQFAYSK